MSHRKGNSEPSTSELRHDWLCDRWVIIAPQRTERPDDFARPCDASSNAELASTDPTQASCPFCSGHETETPPPVAVYSHAGRVCIQPNTANAAGSTDASQSEWLVRVVPNKFPAVNGVQTLKFPGMMAVDAVSSMKDSKPDPQSQPESGKPAIDLFQARNVSGAHEVIIESPHHLCSLTQLDRNSTTMTFHAYRDRLRHWSECLDIAYAVVFKNVGQDAGASLVHTHSQLIATNILPTDVRRAVCRMELFYETEGECLFCRMLKDELDEQVRVVVESSNYVAFCPFASRLPSLVTVVPRKHQSCFETTSDAGLEELSWLVHRLLRSIELCYPQVAYNYVLHTAPQGKRQSPAVHWRLEIFPRLTRVAGFEWGSDCFINPLPPELAAGRLRNSLCRPLLAAN